MLSRNFGSFDLLIFLLWCSHQRLLLTLLVNKYVSHLPPPPLPSNSLWHQLVSYNLTQFWHCLPGDNARFYRGKDSVLQDFPGPLSQEFCYSLESCCCCLVTKSCPTPQFLCPWGFSRQEYWSGLPRPPPGDLTQGWNRNLLMSPALAGGFFTTSAIWEAHTI